MINGSVPRYSFVVNRRWRGYFFAGVVGVAMMIATSALAHQTFLLPSQFLWNVKQPVDVALTSALAFPNLEHGPARDRISFASAVVDGEQAGAFSYTESETFLNLQFSPTRSGLAVIGISSKPRFGDIEPEDADEYFDEIGAGDDIRRAFAALPGSPALRRSYSKHAKTFVCIETCSTGRATSAAPMGQALEFVAADDAENAYLLLRDGKPLPEHSVAVISPDHGNREILTDKGGVVVMDASLPGVVMLSSVVITVPDQPDGVYHSDYATLTVDRSQAR